MPTLVVQRAEPEGVATKTTKSGRSRRVPVADRVLPLVRAMAQGREAEAPLFVTASGHRLHSTAFKRTLGWSALAEGRRIHDLRHRRLPVAGPRRRPGHLQAWMGHASIATTNLYLHHLGTPADRAGLERLNARGHARGHRSGGGVGMTKEEPRPTSRVCAGQTEFPSGGAEGIRTPDLLIANETRYQLRHSPEMRTKL